MLYDMHAYEIDSDRGPRTWDVWKEWPDGDAQYQYSITEEEFPSYMLALKNSGIDIKLHTLATWYVQCVYRGVALEMPERDSILEL